MIDLHSHLLPGVDDGSRTVEQSVKVLQEMARRGITDVCLTPHLRATQAADGPPARHDDAFDALRAAAPELPRLHRGAEVMLDRPLPPGADHMQRIRLGGTRYILVEFPRLVSLDAVTNALGRVRDAGLLAVLAHPERYGCCSVEAVTHWRSLGATMQVDATTLHSTQARGQRARQLVSRGLADILAGDNHGDDRTIAAGADFLIAQDGPEQAELLTVRNPAAILRDEPLAEVPPLLIRRTWTQRIRHLLGGEQ
ncbi:MAG TPA: CpsB/CapC family capsule biosynthesis tyrosine phosphatase [Gemmatimonadales bacterium]|nr:CpsB/CapC family capsule biosynthesis tyrosine phosphatase [Gemmatimonadales bacterium]